MFRDEALLRVQAGRGGDGCVSFHREKYVTRGGPDGGDGGDGGSVIFEAVTHENSLFRLARLRQVQAHNGVPGGSSNKTGARGEDVVLQIPVGTQVRDAKRGNLLADLDENGARVVIAQGGKGGKGNARFASATNQAPRDATHGADGESRELRLELKLVADVGLLGMPNAGKSTLISRLTAARPRVASYPFTTLDPSLGIMETGGEPETLVLADIPGLIEGAADGKGLGHQFLRHVERTRVLLHLVDCSATAEDPIGSYQAIRHELEQYPGDLATRPQVLVATKIEDEDSEQRAAALFEAAGETGLKISSATGRGLDSLRTALLQTFHSLGDAPHGTTK
ncbi:MAG: GTPase ObgE [Planctomycetes bacterium]|nr:GTPase ObgE [Planctomycetota bacterium]